MNRVCPGLGASSSSKPTQPMNQMEHHQKLIDLAFALVKAVIWRNEPAAPIIDAEEGEDPYNVLPMINRARTEFNLAEVHKGAYNDLFDYLHRDCPKPGTIQVLVAIEGGCMTGARSDYPHVAIELRDFDNIRAAGPDDMDPESMARDHIVAIDDMALKVQVAADPVGEFRTTPESSDLTLEAWAKAGYPYAIW